MISARGGPHPEKKNALSSTSAATIKVMAVKRHRKATPPGPHDRQSRAGNQIQRQSKARQIYFMYYDWIPYKMGEKQPIDNK